MYRNSLCQQSVSCQLHSTWINYYGYISTRLLDTTLMNGFKLSDLNSVASNVKWFLYRNNVSLFSGVVSFNNPLVRIAAATLLASVELLKDVTPQLPSVKLLKDVTPHLPSVKGLLRDVTPQLPGVKLLKGQFQSIKCMLKIYLRETLTYCQYLFRSVSFVLLPYFETKKTVYLIRL
jgi:hypothetical protein